MKNFGLIFLIFVFTSLSANATVSTDYLERVYSCQCKKDVTFKSKKEYIDKYEQRLGDKFISSIVYGGAGLFLIIAEILRLFVKTLPFDER